MAPKNVPKDIKVQGVAACRAVARARPEDVRRAFLEERHVRPFARLLKVLSKSRRSYKVVDATELERVSGGVHHEGICLYVAPKPPLTFDRLLQELRRGAGPARLVYLDGVRNPHNLGAILRTAAHFGARAILGPTDSTPGLGPAALRIAEGGAESCDVVALDRPEAALHKLHEAGFEIVAADAKGGRELYAEPLAERVVLALGAEREGLSSSILSVSDARVYIPGSRAVESLNVAAAAAVMLAEHARQHPTRRDT